MLSKRAANINFALPASYYGALLYKVSLFKLDIWWKLNGRGIVANNYWSATENSSTNAYNLNFNNGSVNNNNKSNNNYVRCVRGKQILRSFCGKFKNMSDYTELPLYLRLYQLIKYLHEVVRNFPKQYRYTFGGQILALSWECLDMVLEANVLRGQEKNLKILSLSVSFDKFKIRLRMAQELKLISEKQFCHLQTYYLKEIGGMIGGWLKWSNDNKLLL